MLRASFGMANTSRVVSRVEKRVSVNDYKPASDFGSVSIENSLQVQGAYSLASPATLLISLGLRPSLGLGRHLDVERRK